jgi:hypothetical protein
MTKQNKLKLKVDTISELLLVGKIVTHKAIIASVLEISELLDKSDDPDIFTIKQIKEVIESCKELYSTDIKK